jgi:hypothetical protein
MLKVSRSAYYAAREGSPSRHEAQEVELAAQAEPVHEESKGRDGAEHHQDDAGTANPVAA